MTKEEGPCVSPRRVRVAQKGHGSGATGPAASPSSRGPSMFTYAPVWHTRGVYPIDAVDPERVGTTARRDYCLFPVR